MKVEPLPGSLSTVDLAAHHLAEAPADGEAEAGAAVLAGGGGVGLREAWNSRATCSGVMPMPVSLTRKRIQSPRLSRLRSTRQA